MPHAPGTKARQQNPAVLASHDPTEGFEVLVREQGRGVEVFRSYDQSSIVDPK